MNLEEKFANYISEKQLISPGDAVLLGLSGGSDSVCLLLLLNGMRQQLGFELHAVYIDHNLRGEDSVLDGEFAKELCGRLDVRFFTKSVDVMGYVKSHGTSVEESARILRYEALDELARSCGGAKIAVAHNLQDQAETIIFRMARGTGPLGAAGMRPCAGDIIRPLLFADKQEILDYLDEKGQDYRTDITNSDTKYARNLIRTQIIPALTQINAGAVRHIADLGEMIGKLADEEAAAAESYVNQNAAVTEDGVALATAGLKGATGDFVISVIRVFLRTYVKGLKNVTQVHYEAAADIVCGHAGRMTDIPGGYILKKRRGSIILSKR